MTQLARAIGYDDRIGNKFLRAGVGFGGGCLPKDIRAFQARAQELGAGEALRFLHEVDLINQRRRTRVVQLAAELLGRTLRPGRPGPVRHRGSPCSAPRSSPTPTTSATRRRCRSPRKLARAGAEVAVYDPQGMENAARELARADLRRDA